MRESRSDRRSGGGVITIDQQRFAQRIPYLSAGFLIETIRLADVISKRNHA